MDKYKELKERVLSLEEDVNKTFLKNNKSAGVRLRKSLQDLKALAQELRIEVSKLKKDGEE